RSQPPPHCERTSKIVTGVERECADCATGGVSRRRGTLDRMGEQEGKIRLGGMALQNGVLVHGPTSWAVAVRTEGGELRIASGKKSVRGAEVTNPLLRGPMRILDAFALLPRIRRAEPEARLPFERPAVLA